MKTLFLACGFLLLGVSAMAQKVVEFKLPQPSSAEAFHFYRTIQVVDARTDTSRFGALSGFNEPSKPVVMRPDMQTQLASYAAPSANEGTVFIMELRRMEFWSSPGAFKENAYCKYVADYYAKNAPDAGYLHIRKIDTLFAVKKVKEDAQGKIMALTGDGIIATLSPYLTQEMPLIGAPLLTLNDIKYRDSFEKAKTPFYAAPKLKDGVYWSDTSLYSQQGYDSLNSANVKVKEDILKRYEFWDKKRGEWIYGSIRRPFVIIYQGTPYIFHQAGDQWDYIRMEKRGQDYYYYGKLPSQSNAVGMGAVFGLAGYLATSAIESGQNKGKQLYRFDYLSRRAVLAKPPVPNAKK